MKKELRIIFTAIMFYTRIPCPEWVDHDADNLNKATRYFPLIGWIVGLVTWLIFIAGQYFFSMQISILLSIAGGVLITGAFHEDGFADVCDGFGGGWTSEKILNIMKDSRVGTYGVVGMLLIFALKIFALTELLTFDLYFCIKSVLLAHVGSRFTAVTMMRTHEYAREDASSKVKPLAKQLSLPDFFISALWLLPAF